MDEFDKIRSAYPEQPGPSRQVTLQARAQLQTLTREAAATPRRRLPVGLTPTRLGIGLTAGTAVVAVAALAVPLLLSPESGPGAATPPGTTTSSRPAAISPSTTLSASQVLLVAAVAQEQAEATTGKYFRVRTVSRREYEVGRGKSAYTLEEQRINETWTGAKGGTAWFGSRTLGARPATPADEAQWRRAGSPASWNLGPTDTADKHDLIISSTPGKGTLDERKNDGDRYYALGGEKGVSSAQVLALPTTPAALRTRLLKDKAARAPGADDTSYLVQMTAGLLLETPATPKVRGAALRLLAGLPGAEIQRNVADLQGRKGTAVTFSFPDALVTIQLIIAPVTGKLLSSGHWGGKNGGDVVLASGWTNEKPSVPAAKIR
jgi:hypothetical protein